MARFKTFVNGGTILPGDLNTIEDDYECAFGVYKSLAVDYLVIAYNVTPATTPMPTSGQLWLDPARYWTDASTSSENPRTVYYNLGFALGTWGTAPGITYTAGLYQITGVSGGTPTLAASPITGSTAPIVTPAANTMISQVWSGDFTAPTAGFYAVCVKSSGAAPTGADVNVSVNLQMRQV